MPEFGFLIEHYGYLFVFIILVLGIIGLPMPDEVILTYVGYNVFMGRMSLINALFTAIIGASIGISISYLLGQKLGLPFISKYGSKIRVSEKNIKWVQKHFHKYGGLFLITGYFIPGIRHITAYVAGISTYRFSHFALYAYTGAIVWVSVFIILGRQLGNKWDSISPIFSQVSLFVWGLIVIGIVIYLIHKRSIRVGK